MPMPQASLNLDVASCHLRLTTFESVSSGFTKALDCNQLESRKVTAVPGLRRTNDTHPSNRLGASTF